MSEKIINPHDAFFKQYMGHAVAAADFLRHHLPPAVATILDLGQLRLEKDSFVDEKLRSNFSDLLYRTVTNEGGVLMQTMAEAWIEEGKVIGQKKGREEGREEGKVEERIDLIIRLLRRRFHPTEETLQTITQQLTQIRQEVVLSRLVDLALDVLVLPDFMSQVQALLPTTTPVEQE